MSRLAWLLVPLVALACGRPGSPDYLGQAPPGSTPRLFAPGVVSTAMFERDVAMTPDLREIYWTVTSPGRDCITIAGSRFSDGRWTPPEIPAFAADPRFGHIEPAISADGKRFYFTLAQFSPEGGIARASIQVMDREGDRWGRPRDIGAPINGEWNVFFASPARDGTLYFTREQRDGSDGAIYRSKLVDGHYLDPERLPSQVNAGTARFNAFVAPDERYLIVPIAGLGDSFGGVDYYVVFRNPDGSWTDPVNLGRDINTASSGEYSPYVSPGGKFFFFMSSRHGGKWPVERLSYDLLVRLMQRPGNGSADIYWVDASFIDRLRPVGSGGSRSGR